MDASFRLGSLAGSCVASDCVENAFTESASFDGLVAVFLAVFAAVDVVVFVVFSCFSGVGSRAVIFADVDDRNGDDGGVSVGGDPESSIDSAGDTRIDGGDVIGRNAIEGVIERESAVSAEEGTFVSIVAFDVDDGTGGEDGCDDDGNSDSKFDIGFDDDSAIVGGDVDGIFICNGDTVHCGAVVDKDSDDGSEDEMGSPIGTVGVDAGDDGTADANTDDRVTDNVTADGDMADSRSADNCINHGVSDSFRTSGDGFSANVANGGDAVVNSRSSNGFDAGGDDGCVFTFTTSKEGVSNDVSTDVIADGADADTSISCDFIAGSFDGSDMLL